MFGWRYEHLKKNLYFYGAGVFVHTIYVIFSNICDI
jgi:hypothetical protein